MEFLLFKGDGEKIKQFAKENLPKNSLGMLTLVEKIPQEHYIGSDSVDVINQLKKIFHLVEVSYPEVLQLESKFEIFGDESYFR